MTTDTTDRDGLVAQVGEATAQVLDSARELTEAEMRASSLLPGWTRGHVLTHLARNADSFTRALTGVRTGGDTARYDSVQARADAIDAGADRPAADLVEDVRASHERLAEAIRATPADGWERDVHFVPGDPGRPAAGILWSRLQELQVHHVDLDAGYTPAHWPAGFVTRCLDGVARWFDGRDDVPVLVLVAEDTGRTLGIHADPATADGTAVRVSGPAAALLAWLIGRAPGDGLDVEPAGSLPTLPDWS